MDKIIHATGWVSLKS